jgi:hypothetical protein
LANGGHYQKIGISWNPELRVKALAFYTEFLGYCPYLVREWYRPNDARAVELHIKRSLRGRHMGGVCGYEWFKVEQPEMLGIVNDALSLFDSRSATSKASAW